MPSSKQVVDDQIPLDPNMVIESLRHRIANDAIEIAKRDVLIDMLNTDRAVMRTEIDEISARLLAGDQPPEGSPEDQDEPKELAQ